MLGCRGISAPRPGGGANSAAVTTAEADCRIAITAQGRAGDYQQRLAGFGSPPRVAVKLFGGIALAKSICAPNRDSGGEIPLRSATAGHALSRKISPEAAAMTGAGADSGAEADANA